MYKPKAYYILSKSITCPFCEATYPKNDKSEGEMMCRFCNKKFTYEGIYSLVQYKIRKHKDYCQHENRHNFGSDDTNIYCPECNSIEYNGDKLPFND